MTALKVRQPNELDLQTDELDLQTIEERLKAGDVVALLAEIDAGRFGNREEAMKVLRDFVAHYRGPGLLSQIKKLFFAQRSSHWQY